MLLPDHFQSGRAMLSQSDAVSPGQGERIRASPLDSIGLSAVSFIKIDAEGSEAKVLRGGHALITRDQPMIAFENGKLFHDTETTLEPMRWLRDRGYLFFQLAWLRGTGDTEFFFAEDYDAHPRSEETLSLVPFDLEERFLRLEAMNIVACHRDRLPTLERSFAIFRN